ncbi:MAG: hypothetical protein V3V22_03235 [Methylococcales bacterium]
MNKYEWAQIVSIWIVIFFVVFYAAIVCAAYVFKWQRITQIIQANPAFTIGIIASASGSFGIVSLFWKLYPPSEKLNGTNYQLSVLGLEFTGPGGPITLWLLCFMALVMAMKTLSKP